MTLKHSWGERVPFEHKTERQCTRCPLVKVTRHEGDVHWMEYWQDGEKLDRRPDCVASKRAE